MLNLLTNEQRKKIKREYSLRFWSVVFFAFSFLTIVLGVAFFPPYIFLSTRKMLAEDSINNAKNSSENKNLINFEKQLDELNLKVKSFSLEKEDLSTVMAEATKNLPKGIKVTSISFSRSDDGGVKGVLKGEALSRSDLVTFQKQIKANTFFNSSEFPVSDLVSDKNIGFVINLVHTSQK